MEHRLDEKETISTLLGKFKRIPFDFNAKEASERQVYVLFAVSHICNIFNGSIALLQNVQGSTIRKG